ncbi:Hsp70 family protein [Verrucosispora sp. WMMA2044]|uniref:Hsp70 family protein n=1 Tax=Verrucosispora sp. WMMA2044 TaxID=3016419 RepID=UPI00248B18CB|nr:Hsp70 family protein [Verrucosispora sp. WMMA2044]WBB48440.1 Hsp70 family protein [Verrucosispora sp. WMMA2044]
MRAGQARLAIDCGSATTTAVLAWPDGSWSPLLFDGEPALPSAVLVAGDGSVVTGQRAWQAATADPQRFIPRPRLSVDEQVSVADVQVAPADLVAATLRRVVDEAHRMAGGPVEDVRLVVPAGWGPRRRTWLRQAAHRAGLAQPRLVEAPVAVASDALASGVQLPVGSVVVVCDLGAGVEVSVLRRGPAGFEVLSTLADPDAGGDAIDAALTATVLPDGGVPAADGWALTASLRTAKHALVGHAAVAVPVPSGPAVVLNHLMVEQAARPALVRAAGLVRNAVDAAEVDPATIAALWCVGGTAQMPLVADVLAAETGLRPTLVPDPLVAAARGAVDAGGLDTGQAAVVAEPVPSVWRAVAIGVPGFASLALVSHALFTPTWHSGLMREWAFMNWGEVAMASVFAVIACLAAGTVLGSTLAARTDSGVPLSAGAQVATGILTSAWLGVAVVGMYAVVGSQYIGTELGAFLRWTMVPVVPMLVVAMVLALIAFRQWRTPKGGWSDFLAFPVTSVVTATVGMMLVQWSLPATYAPGMEVWLGVAQRVGGLLIGVGVITALVSGWWLRLVMGVPFAILTATLVGRYNTGTVAGLYIVAATVWWLGRLWTRILYTAPTQSRRSLPLPGPPHP